MRQKNLLAIFLCGAFFVLAYVPFGYSQQTQKKLEPSLSPQVPPKVQKEQTQKKIEPSPSLQVPPRVQKQQPPAVKDQKGDSTRPKTILPDLDVVSGLRMIRGIEVTQLRTGGEWWFSVSFSFDVENRGMAPAERFETWLVSEMVGGSMIGTQLSGRGSKHSLLPHERRTYLGTYLFPPEYAERTVRVRAYIDPLNETTETDESNNSSDWFDLRLPTPLPDLDVRILSILSPTAGNLNPSTGRLEGSGAPEHLIPVYVFMNCSVVVRNNGLAPARGIRVDMDAEGSPGRFFLFELEVPDSRYGTRFDVDATLIPGEERTFSGLLRPPRLSLPEYRRDLEGRRLRFRAEVDRPFVGGAHLVESDETNNYSSWTSFFTMPPPTITLEPGVVSVPDLSITIDNIEVTDRSTYPDLDICTITITVTNIGTAPSGTASGLDLSILDREGWNRVAWSRGFRSLAPGESLTYAVLEDLAVSKTATKARAVIDSDHWTLEVDRSNNQAERNFPLKLVPHLPEEEIRR